MVVVPDGPSRRVGPGGLMVGRQGDCDIVATDPSVSRRHALVHLTSDGVEVVPLGKTPTLVNGKELANPALLADGDELGVPGLVLRIQIELPKLERSAPSSFVLVRGAGQFGVSHSPFVIGGGDTDDLIVAKWPASVLALHLAQGDLYVEARDAHATHNEEPLEPATLAPLAVGDRLGYGSESFIIAQPAGRVATTAVGLRGETPSRATIEILPRGGRIVFTVAGREHAVYLPDRRFDLMVALLRPPAEYKAGDMVPDDTIRAIVWPRRHDVSRPEINTLISRCRRDLVEAGLAGPRLIERAQGGGGVRLLLAAGATVEVLS